MISVLPGKSAPSSGTTSDAVVVSSSQNDQAPMVVGPQIKADVAPIMSVGSVFDAGSMVGKTAGLTSFTLNMDNSAGVTPVDYLMFDQFGLFAFNSGLTVSAPTSGSSSVAAIFAMSASAPMLLKGYNYQVSDVTQFSNDLKAVYGDADGTTIIKPIPTNQAKRNTQFVATLLTFDCSVYIDGFRGLLLTVDAGATVNLTLFVAVNYNRQ